MKRLRKFLRLSGIEQRLLLKAVLLLGAIRLGLWLLPFQTLRRCLAESTRIGIKPREKRERPSRERIIWAVETAGRFTPPAATCLTQALTAQVLLLRWGYPALLRIGAAKEEGERFMAHAWVESEGKVVIGGHGIERYTLLASLQGKGA